MGNSFSLRSKGDFKGNYVFSIKKPMNFARSNQGDGNLRIWTDGLCYKNKSLEEWNLLDESSQLNAGVGIPEGTVFEVTDIIIKGTINFPLNCATPSVYPLVKIISSSNKDIIGLEMEAESLFPNYYWNALISIELDVKMEQGDLVSLIGVLKETYESEFGDGSSKSGIDQFINGSTYRNKVKECFT